MRQRKGLVWPDLWGRGLGDRCLAPCHPHLPSVPCAWGSISVVAGQECSGSFWQHPSPTPQFAEASWRLSAACLHLGLSIWHCAHQLPPDRPCMCQLGRQQTQNWSQAALHKVPPLPAPHHHGLEHGHCVAVTALLISAVWAAQIQDQAAGISDFGSHPQAGWPWASHVAWRPCSGEDFL